MTRRQVRRVHCYRCIYTWRARYRRPRMCPRCKSLYWNLPKVRPVRLGHGLGIAEVLGPHRSEILRLARKFGVKNIRVFGSVRRREAGPRSDVDLLVEWSPDSSLLDSGAFRVALKQLLGRSVDTVDERFLHWAIRPHVLAEAFPL
jgi:uncharacterized protein